jgi:hypothetical protein
MRFGYSHSLLHIPHVKPLFIVACRSWDLTSLQPRYGRCAKRTYETFVCVVASVVNLLRSASFLAAPASARMRESLVRKL